ncbi:MAG TPA: hypothetical protein VGK71_07075 [Nitrospirota bacterium]
MDGSNDEIFDSENCQDLWALAEKLYLVEDIGRAAGRIAYTASIEAEAKAMPEWELLADEAQMLEAVCISASTDLSNRTTDPAKDERFGLFFKEALPMVRGTIALVQEIYSRMLALNGGIAEAAEDHGVDALMRQSGMTMDAIVFASAELDAMTRRLKLLCSWEEEPDKGQNDGEDGEAGEAGEFAAA